MSRLLRLFGVLAAAAALAAAVAVTPAGARVIRSGVITVGRGAGPITLGMTRSQVVSKLGRPLYENANGYMQYAQLPSIFDVYRTGGGSRTRVRMLVIGGSGFRLSDGNRIFARGGLRRLSKRYGKQLKFHNTPDTGPYYELISRFQKRRVRTQFFVTRRSLDATVLDVFILFG